MKPEHTESFEAGLTMRFLKGFSIYLTYYHMNTRNQILNPPVSSGFTNICIQSGDMRNQGIELELGYSNTWGSFGFNVRITF